MSKIRFLLFFWGGIFLFTSCVSLQTVSIDQLEPAKITFPAKFRKVLVVNNVRSNNVDSSESILKGNGKVATEALAQGIADANYFDEVIICDSALQMAGQSIRTAGLEPEEVVRLSDEFGVDMVVSLEELLLRMQKSLSYFPDFPLPEPVVDAHIKTVVCVYAPGEEKPMATALANDSIYWFLSQMSTSEERISEASELGAEQITLQLVPSWNTVQRYYYAGGSVDMRDAAVYVRQNQWEDAFSAWQRAQKQKSKKVRMRSAFNMSLYYELRDDIENAEKWLQQAETLLLEEKSEEELKETLDYMLMAYYQEEIAKRKVSLQKLSIQMSRFNDDF